MNHLIWLQIESFKNRKSFSFHEGEVEFKIFIGQRISKFSITKYSFVLRNQVI